MRQGVLRLVLAAVFSLHLTSCILKLCNKSVIQIQSRRRSAAVLPMPSLAICKEGFKNMPADTLENSWFIPPELICPDEAGKLECLGENTFGQDDILLGAYRMSTVELLFGNGSSPKARFNSTLMYYPLTKYGGCLILDDVGGGGDGLKPGGPPYLLSLVIPSYGSSSSLQAYLATEWRFT